MRAVLDVKHRGRACGALLGPRGGLRGSYAAAAAAAAAAYMAKVVTLVL